MVFYEAVPSEIRTIQRRGRTGRKREGRVIVLVAKGTRDEGYLRAEKRKERQMKETIRDFGHEKDAPGDDSPDDAGGTQPQPAIPAKKSIPAGGGNLFHWLKPK